MQEVFSGIGDLISALPTYLSLLVPGAHGLFSIHLLRALRIFRALRLLTFIHEANFLTQAR